MLPDCPKVRQPINEAITVALRELISQRPLLASIRSEYFFEGNMWGGFGEQVDVASHGFRAFEAPSAVPTAELIDRGPDALAARLPELANAMADAIERRMLERIRETAGRPGEDNVIAANLPETCDEMVEQLGRMRIDFDESGAPIMPMLVAHPGMIERLRRWDQDEECKAKWAAILKTKREEFDARESHRALVD